MNLTSMSGPGALLMSKSNGVLDLQCETHDGTYPIRNNEKFNRCDGSVFQGILGNRDDHFI